MVALYQKHSEADGVDATPMFIINGVKVDNAPYEEIAKKLDEALAPDRRARREVTGPVGRLDAPPAGAQHPGRPLPWRLPDAPARDLLLPSSSPAVAPARRPVARRPPRACRRRPRRRPPTGSTPTAPIACSSPAPVVGAPSRPRRRRRDLSRRAPRERHRRRGRRRRLITVYSLREPSLLLLAGDFEAMTGDGAADLIVIEPKVFLGVPAGVTLQIAVQGFTAAEDRILLRLPPGVTPEFWPNPAIALRAGPVAIAVATVDDPMPVTAAAFRIEPAAPAYQPAWAAPAAAFAAYDPGLLCADAPPVAATPAGRAGLPALPVPPAAFHARPASRCGSRATPGPRSRPATRRQAPRLRRRRGAGGRGRRPRPRLRDPGRIPCRRRRAGIGVRADLDADTIVFEAARLQAAPHTLALVNLNPLNDRIVLRLPPGLEPQFERPKYGAAAVQVGTLRITKLAQVWERVLDYSLDPSAFAIDRLPAP